MQEFLHHSPLKLHVLLVQHLFNMMHAISFAKLCAPLSINVFDALHFGRGAQVYIDAQNL
jgi:hypothetical protein